MIPVGEVPAVCEGVYAIVRTCAYRLATWVNATWCTWVSAMVVTPATSSVGGSIIMRGLRIVASGY